MTEQTNDTLENNAATAAEHNMEDAAEAVSESTDEIIEERDEVIEETGETMEDADDATMEWGNDAAEAVGDPTTATIPMELDDSQQDFIANLADISEGTIQLMGMSFILGSLVTILLLILLDFMRRNQKN